MNDEIDAKYIEEWANLIECRDDIGFESSMVQEIIFELANPVIYGFLTKERVKDLFCEF